MEVIKDYIKDKKTNKIVLPRIKTECIDDIAEITNQLANINYLLSQSIAENYTDESEAYTKQISDGTSPFGRLDYVGGKSMGGYAVVDLGSLNWTYQASGSGVAPFFSTPFSLIKSNGSPATNKPNIYCPKYKTVARNVNDFVNGTICVDGSNTEIGWIQIKDNTTTDINAFKNSLKGVYLLYEQKTPSDIYNVELTEIISKGANRDIATYPTADIIKKYFVDGMKSAGAVYDEFNLVKGKAIKRIGVVDLGSLSWARFETNGFHALLPTPTPKPKDAGTKFNAICEKYEVSAQTTYGSFDKTICLFFTSSTDTSSRLIIRDKSVDDATQLRSLVNGTMLYFELATPTETDIDNADIEALKVIEVEANGTITMQNEFHLAIPSSQTFQRIRGVASLFDEGINAMAEE